jgi:hypothetical protein
VISAIDAASPKVTVHWLSLQFRILEITRSISAKDRRPHGLPQFLQANTGIVYQIWSDQLLPHHFQFIIQLPSLSSEPKSLLKPLPVTWRYNTKGPVPHEGKGTAAWWCLAWLTLPLPKCRTLSEMHGVTTRKAVSFIVEAVRIINPEVSWIILDFKRNIWIGWGRQQSPDLSNNWHEAYSNSLIVISN